MPGKVIGIQTNYGYPGSLSRTGDEVSRTRPVNAASADIYFGDPVSIGTDGSVTRFGASDTAATFAGIAMRNIKSAITYLVQSNGLYTKNEPCNVLERGAIAVNCNVGTPTVGGAVYIRTVLNGAIPLGVVGGYETAADSTNTILLTNAKWATGKDANNVAELVITNRLGV